jgi:hypothetical protein
MSALNHNPLYHKSSQAVSPNSQILRRLEFNAQSYHKNTLTEGLLDIFESDILDVQKQCSSGGWDGYNAEPISLETAKNLILFYREKISPLNVLNPEISPSSDGFLGLEWISDYQDRILIVPEIETIVYASIVRANKNHGEIGIKDELPETIVRMLKKYFSPKFN